MPAKKSNPDAMTMRPVSIGNALNHTGKAQNTPISNEFIFISFRQATHYNQFVNLSLFCNGTGEIMYVDCGYNIMGY